MFWATFLGVSRLKAKSFLSSALCDDLQIISSYLRNWLDKHPSTFMKTQPHWLPSARPLCTWWCFQTWPSFTFELWTTTFHNSYKNALPSQKARVIGSHAAFTGQASCERGRSSNICWMAKDLWASSCYLRVWGDGRIRYLLTHHLIFLTEDTKDWEVVYAMRWVMSPSIPLLSKPHKHLTRGLKKNMHEQLLEWWNYDFFKKSQKRQSWNF